MLTGLANAKVLKGLKKWLQAVWLFRSEAEQLNCETNQN